MVSFGNLESRKIEKLHLAVLSNPESVQPAIYEYSSFA